MRVGNGGKDTRESVEKKISGSSIEDRVRRGSNKLSGKEESLRGTEDILFDISSDELENEKISVDEEKVNLETEKNVGRKGKDNRFVRKGNEKREKIPIKRTLGRLSRGRLVSMVAIGVVSSIFLSGVVYGVYYNVVRYPWMAVGDKETSGIGAIERWVSAINTLDSDTISGITGEDSYLAKELVYANNNEDKIAFIRKMVSTVEYVPQKVEAMNIYGNTMLERGTDEVVYTDSLVNGDNEEVTLKYIDYLNVPLDAEEIRSLMKEEGLKVGDVDYSNKLVGVFCKYMISLEDDEIPLKEVKHIPNMVYDGTTYSMTLEEDIVLDKALFSSEEFHEFLDMFSAVAGSSGEDNPEWGEWNALSEEEKAEVEEPSDTIDSIEPTDSWLEWSALSDEEKEDTGEPLKYDSKMVASKDWCGAYYLMNDFEVVDSDGNVVKRPISAEVGDGTFENPAGLNTDVVTSIYVSEEDENGNVVRVAKPVRIRLLDYRVSQDAINYFESKDVRNRGLDIKSEIQYVGYVLEVTNLSDSTLTVYDDSGLSDSLSNISPRTGNIFGLQSTVTLEPDETGIIESWGSSTELNTKYLVWGSGFKRDEPVVWFRVLAGNIDDPSDSKGVTLNTSRNDSSSSTSSSTDTGSSNTSESTSLGTSE